ncbi:uncharacterized protein MONOS_13662 [Monocercomonoides exilis]|uniref:uncharacterized protein n=1 Tax=Monocercomonoides exilis TaxID=2049356 RepID=UPI003559BEB1|nr:hypothetical protein MONOS_13662 [Monocercomonoides exilis]|eukprot:MONOS_13662.1-p1 / transcript=MONOS_13662.1 / gene=MONOS_13662 / organism=Monocercomonoides_exilis_PA203 / gene_product=unspecified product / transcript_product=unspecified product / location=Mono_scaffold00860:9777-10241(+) / protein_length=115 / sequence_SO=supercontig / SO=protein_coding / is_pseudo=false
MQELSSESCCTDDVEVDDRSGDGIARGEHRDGVVWLIAKVKVLDNKKTNDLRLQLCSLDWLEPCGCCKAPPFIEQASSVTEGQQRKTDVLPRDDGAPLWVMVSLADTRAVPLFH